MGEEAKQSVVVVEERVPERIRQVEFNENVRLPASLSRVAMAVEGRALFLEKGCVVSRVRMQDERGQEVVRTVAVPLSGGLVRTITFEDEVVSPRCRNWPEGARAHACEECAPDEIAKLNEEYARQHAPGGERPVSTGTLLTGLNGKAGTTLPTGEDEEQRELVARLKGDGNPALQKVAERLEQLAPLTAPQEQTGTVQPAEAADQPQANPRRRQR